MYKMHVEGQGRMRKSGRASGGREVIGMAVSFSKSTIPELGHAPAH